MKRLRAMVVRFAGFLRRRKHEAEMDEEMRVHLEALIERNVAAGMSAEEARHAARRKFGGVEQAKEESRDSRRGVWAEQLRQDLRYAVRALAKTPSFTVTAVLTLALGIGVNAALFTVFNAVSLRPLPVRAPDELVTVRGRSSDGRGRNDSAFSHDEFLRYRESNRVFSDLAAHFAGMRGMDLDTAAGDTGDAGSEERAARQGTLALVQHVSENYFALLGAEMRLGRTFSEEEAFASSADPVIVLSHAFWERHLAKNPEVLSQTVRLSGRPHRVVGVTGPEFVGGNPAPPAGWLPLGPEMRRADAPDRSPLLLIGRLKPGVPAETAKADLDGIAQRLAREFPRPGRKTSVELAPGMRWIYIPLNPMTIAVFSPVLFGFGMVLLIACSNVTNLLLARGVTRYQEIGVRLTLGASRGRIMRQLLTENLLLCALGGIAGLVLALWSIQIFRPIVLSYLPPEWAPLTEMWNFLSFAPDYRVLLGTAALIAIAAAAAGLAPAWHASRANLVSALKDEGSAFGRKLAHSRLRNFLVISQVAVCLVLLSGAGLLVRNLVKLRGADVGFDYKGIQDVGLDLEPLRGEPRKVRVLEAVEMLRTLPGVVSATVVHGAPLLGAPQATVKTRAGGADEDERGAMSSQYAVVTAGFFDTFGIALQQGRAFTAAEVDTRANVAVISESLAHRLWPEEPALGKILFLNDANAQSPALRSPVRGAGVAYEIVGIARDVQTRLMEPDRAFVYLPVRDGQGFSGLYLRPRERSEAALAAIKRAAEGAGLKVVTHRRVGAKLEEDMLPFLGAAWTSGLLAGLALLMAAVGLYGVMSFAVRRRTREIGIRIALGATAERVVRLFVRQGMRLVAIGAAIGLGGTGIFLLALSRVWSGSAALETNKWLREVVLDPVAYGAVVLLLAAVAWLACWLPARRATKVEPMVALRCE